MRVRRATVIGAGVMGSGIAAHLANAGIPVWLLDVPSAEVTDEDRRAGRGAGHPDVRNRLARAGRERVLRATPSGFRAPELASLVTSGNVEDDLSYVWWTGPCGAFLGLLGETKTRDRIRHMLDTGKPLRN